MFWKRKPITHAAGLWALVGLAAAGLIAVMSYAAVMADRRAAAPEAMPEPAAPVRQEQPPSLFGTVVSFDGTVLRVDSKQPYDEVIVTSETSITTVGGSETSASELKPGTVITATGRDAGDRRLSAAAIVILESRP